MDHTETCIPKQKNILTFLYAAYPDIHIAIYRLYMLIDTVFPHHGLSARASPAQCPTSSLSLEVNESSSTATEL